MSGFLMSGQSTFFVLEVNGDETYVVVDRDRDRDRETRELERKSEMKKSLEYFDDLKKRMDQLKSEIEKPKAERKVFPLVLSDWRI